MPGGEQSRQTPLKRSISPFRVMLEERVNDRFLKCGDLRRTGVSILLVEQNARAALQVTDYGYVLETGEIAHQGRSAELSENPRVIESYLGLASKS